MGRQQTVTTDLEHHLRKLEWQRKQRALTGNRYTKTYEKTPHGFLMRLHRNMRSRVLGIQKKRAHLYLGLSVLPREEFYSWAQTHSEFWRLWRNWQLSGHARKLVPTVNRIDSEKGYTLDNMEWLTHSANSALGARNR